MKIMISQNLKWHSEKCSFNVVAVIFLSVLSVCSTRCTTVVQTVTYNSLTLPGLQPGKWFPAADERHFCFLSLVQRHRSVSVRGIFLFTVEHICPYIFNIQYICCGKVRRGTCVQVWSLVKTLVSLWVCVCVGVWTRDRGLTLGIDTVNMGMVSDEQPLHHCQGNRPGKCHIAEEPGW